MEKLIQTLTEGTLNEQNNGCCGAEATKKTDQANASSTDSCCATNESSTDSCCSSNENSSTCC